MTSLAKGLGFKLVLVSFLLFSNNTYGQEQNSPREKAENFLEEILQGRGNQALENIFSEEMALAVSGAIAQGQQELGGFIKLGGLPEGYEFFSEEIFSERITKVVYFYYMENLPLIFEFYFYQTQRGWEVVALNFDADFIEFSKRK